MPDDGSPISFEKIHFTLRTRQIQYLEYISERDDALMSQSLRKVIERSIENIYVDPPIQTCKVRKNFSLPAKCVEFVNLLAQRWGLPQSDVVRRLIDDAAARDLTA